MPRYADFRYGAGEFYGPEVRVPRASYLDAVVLDYDQVQITVDATLRTGQGYVLVRSRAGSAEDPSGGVIVASGNVPAAAFTVVDGVANFADAGTDNDVGVPPGLVYYTLFVFAATGRWLKDAATSVLVAEDKGTWERLMYWLPSVFTAADQNPLSDPDFDGDLAQFLYPFAFTYDEMATYLGLVLPERLRRASIRRMHDAMAEGVGMPSEYTIGVRATSRLHRDAGYLFGKKGTLAGVSAYVEALTGWDAKAFDSPNRLLSLDDASFETSVGGWTASGGTITRQSINGSTITGPVADYDDPVQPYGKTGVARIALTSATATATLPGSLSREASIPVAAGTAYTYTAYARATSGTPSLALGIAWLDNNGTVLSSSTQSATASTASWVRRSLAATAPAGAQFARLTITATGSSGNSVDVDMVQLSSSDVAYQDPRLVTVVCAPTRVNLLSDPGFDLTTAWAATTGTFARTTEKVHLGTYAGKAVGSTNYLATSESITVRAGYSYSLAGYAARGTSGTASARIDWYGSGGTLISSSTASFGTLTTSWSRADLTATAPTGAATAKIALVGTGTAYFDSFCFERTDRPQVYFDSATADAAAEDGKLATVGSKRYHLLYSNRLTKISRAITTLPYYLPTGVTGRIVLWDSLDPAVQALIPYDGE